TLGAQISIMFARFTLFLNSFVYQLAILYHPAVDSRRICKPPARQVLAIKQVNFWPKLYLAQIGRGRHRRGSLPYKLKSFRTTTLIFRRLEAHKLELVPHESCANLLGNSLSDFFPRGIFGFDKMFTREYELSVLHPDFRNRLDTACHHHDTHFE